MTDDKKESTGSDLLIDLLYAIAIGINVYLLMDVATHGELSRVVVGNYRHWRLSYDQWRHRTRQEKLDRFEVVQQALDIVKENDR